MAPTLHSMRLTQAQIDFVTHHRISKDELFDATGMTREQYQAAMARSNSIIAYGVSPCESGHTLRTRAGHCAQCDPARIAFVRRHNSPGLVYIAGSIKGMRIKIGFTKSKDVRTESLRRTSYGGFDDWVILCTAKCQEGGQIELEVGKLLTKYSVAGSYKHDGRTQETYELFTCSYQTAVTAMKSIKDDHGKSPFESLQEVKHELPRYSFRNLVRT